MTSSRCTESLPRIANIQFWGTESTLSRSVLEVLVADVTLHAVVVATPISQGLTGQASIYPLQQQLQHLDANELPLTNYFVHSTTVQTAWHAGLPTYGIRNLDHLDVATILQGMAPDIILVTCLPWRIPPAILAIPTYGFVNLHPSLLPEFRGPAPLFWQLRAGRQSSGVTLHWMDERFDTGDIIDQAEFRFPDGATPEEIDHCYAQVGASLLKKFLHEFAAGKAKRQRQASGGSRQSWPQLSDFQLDRNWSARHAYNFMRGTAEWHQPYTVHIDDKEYVLLDALAYDEEGRMSEAFSVQGSHLSIQFSPGILHATTGSGPFL